MDVNYKGGKYSNGVRLGNWNEEIQLEDLKVKDYLNRKEKGALFVLTKQLRLENSLRRVATHVDSDGVLRIGNKIMLKNASSGCFIAGDSESIVTKEVGDCIGTTTSRNDVPCARSVFTIQAAGDQTDNLLRYGESIRFCAETLSSVRTYLQSESISPLSYSRVSRKQEVTLSAVPNGETLWQILHADGKLRFATQGKPVNPTDAFVIRHVGTGSYLASDSALEVRNLQGLEYEVHCHCYYSTNKTHNLYSERNGQITGDYALRRHGVQNLWTVIHN